MTMGLSKKPYSAGVKAFKEGRPASENPHSRGQLRERCAWAGGWADADMGYHSDDEQEEGGE